MRKISENESYLNSEKTRCYDTAKDLCYSKTVLESIKEAKSIFELDNIMTTARKRR